MSRFTSISLLLVALAPLGCATTNTQKAESTASGLHKLSSSLESGKGTINGVVQAVVQMSSAEAGDLKSYLATYTTAVAKVKTQVEHVRALQNSLRETRQGFVAAWDKSLPTIKDEDLRAKSKQRRDDMVAQFQKLEDFRRPAAEAFEAWFQKVNDVEAFLKQNLTPAGIADLTDQFDAIKDGAGNINTSIDGLVTRLSGVAKTLDTAYPKPAS